jgi:hypothetical protein
VEDFNVRIIKNNLEEFINEYKLPRICSKQKDMYNIAYMIKLIYLQIHLYNETSIEEDSKKPFLMNIMILCTTVIEALLYSSLDRLEKFRPKIIKNLVISSLSFKEKIALAEKVSLITLSGKTLNIIRNIRNYVHVFLIPNLIVEDEYISNENVTILLTWINELALNLDQNLAVLKS